MTSDNIITIVTSLAFGPAVAIILLRWVLARASAQDQQLQTQAAELATLRQRLDELEGKDRLILTDRLTQSSQAESKLIAAVDALVTHAERLVEVVTSLEHTLTIRPCQLPEPILAMIRKMLREPQVNKSE